MAKLPKIYVEDPDLEFWLPNLSDEEFEKVSRRFIKTSTDAVIVNWDKRMIYLAKRIVHSMKGWWYIGGSMLPGESWEESMGARFARDTGLGLPAERFEYVMPQRHWSALRGEEPKEAGEDCTSYVFAVELTEEELEFAREHLVPDRYNIELGIEGFNRKGLCHESVRPAILDLYDELFPQRRPVPPSDMY